MAQKNKNHIVIIGEGLASRCAVEGLIKNFSVDLITTDEDLKRDFKGAVNFVEFFQFSEASGQLVLLAGTKRIISPDLIEKNKVLNLHPSLLPKYRGLHSVVWAMLNGDSVVGLSLHEVDELVDHGPILFQWKAPVGKKSAYAVMTSLHAQFQKQIAGVLKKYLGKKLKAKKQNHAAATYCGRRRPEDCKIDWTRDSRYMERFFQALQPPYPRPFFYYEGKTYQVLEASFQHADSLERPGYTLFVDEDGVVVKLGRGFIKLQKLEHDGREISARSVLTKNFIQIDS